ncbi:MAG: ACT domain-containing protein [Candidatus Lokiarchaeota archaeon]|nr:ACT domain-containing protein [Candidatus Lokiarchaeota archaeon]
MNGMVTQISIFLPNRPNQLAKVTGILMKEKVNIRALTVSETSDYGILRMIVSDPDKAQKVLQGSFLVDQTDVIACALKDAPGGLNEIATVLGDSGVNIEYLYAFVGKATQAVLILRVENQMRSKAIDVLGNAGVRIYDPEEIYSM